MFVKEAMRTHSRILATEEVSMGLCHRAARPVSSGGWVLPGVSTGRREVEGEGPIGKAHSWCCRASGPARGKSGVMSLCGVGWGEQ